ncbi:MAG TPA: ATP-binding protein [Gemmatimonadaceae bacterium]|nr:ATP-binding protein [Gemmatimonadaceae bacterium]
MTERRQGQERRFTDRAADRAEERQLRSIIEQLPDGIVIVGSSGLIRFANPAAEQLFGRSARDLVGTEFGFAIANGSPAEIDVLRPGGETVKAELRVVEIVWEGEPSKVISIRDVTDRRRAEEHARQAERERAARAEAEAANRAKSEFLATMSHELRTPLNAVLGYAQLLEMGVGGTLRPEQQQQVDRILTSGRHLLGLVNEVLDLAKVDAGRLSVQIAPTSADETVDAAATLLRPTAEAVGVALTVTRMDQSSVYYDGDEDRVRQILVNLLSNAVKFTEGGGAVELKYGEANRPDPEARLGSRDGCIFFRVTDTGTGIPSDQLSRIFEPFVQVDSGHTRPNDGSGLGLAISRRLARLMRGDITVHSTVGEGSTFTLWLPSSGETKATATVTESRGLSRSVSQTHGLGDVGQIILRELDHLMDGFVARVRSECGIPGANTLRFSQIADHVASYLADIAGVLISLEEVEKQPSSLLADAADIHRLVAARHGTQRARLGWSEAALRCEYRILGEEIGAVVRPRGASIPPAAFAEASAMIRRLLDQAEQYSVRAFARAKTEEKST